MQPYASQYQVYNISYSVSPFLFIAKEASHNCLIQQSPCLCEGTQTPALRALPVGGLTAERCLHLKMAPLTLKQLLLSLRAEPLQAVAEQTQTPPLNITAPKPQPGHQQVTAEAQTGTNTFKIHLLPTRHFTLRKHHLVIMVIALIVCSKIARRIINYF